ncbi:MAG: tyrosine-type recombinase/integrase [Bryobacteraceae bacterium]
MTLLVQSPALDFSKLGRRMPRERHQNGWVTPSGKSPRTWTGYWYVYETADGKDKRLQRSKVLGLRSELTKGQAEYRLLEFIRNGEPPPEKASFEQIARWYLAVRQGAWSRKMQGVMKSIFENHILPAPAFKQNGTPKLLSEITKSDVEVFLNSKAHLSHSLVKKCLTHVRAVFEQAIDDGRLSRNPARKAKMPKTKKPSERFLSLEECKRLLLVAMGRDHLIVRLFMVCGLRPSELFSLRLDDILPGELRVDEGVVMGDLGPTKTDDADGSVPLPPSLEAELRAYVRENGIRDSRAFLFPSEAGTPLAQDNFLDRHLKPLGQLAGIKDLNHQVLRRTCSTHFQKFGKVKDAQALLRHADASTTLRYYQKTLDESLTSGVRAWDEALTN